MDEYFKSYRRKIGVITLAVACVFVAGWVRTCTEHDQFTVPLGNDRIYRIFVLPHGISINRFGAGKGGPRMETHQEKIAVVPHLLIVGPLIALSAWLLLSKSRTWVKPSAGATSGQP